MKQNVNTLNEVFGCIPHGRGAYFFLPGVTTIVIDVITVVVENTPKCGRLAA